MIRGRRCRASRRRDAPAIALSPVANLQGSELRQALRPLCADAAARRLRAAAPLPEPPDPLRRLSFNSGNQLWKKALPKLNPAVRFPLRVFLFLVIRFINHPPYGISILPSWSVGCSAFAATRRSAIKHPPCHYDGYPIFICFVSKNCNC